MHHGAAHGRAGRLLHRHHRQAQSLVHLAEQRHRVFDRCRTGLHEEIGVQRHQLVVQLDLNLDGMLKVSARERASNALVRNGREVLLLLQDELSKTTSAEQRRRLQAAIDAIARSPVPSDRLRQVRVLALLEQLKTDAARSELKRLAAGHAAAALTRDAKAAVKR